MPKKGQEIWGFRRDHWIWQIGGHLSEKGICSLVEDEARLQEARVRLEMRK